MLHGVRFFIPIGRGGVEILRRARIAFSFLSVG
jgi:hypothetical protein